jgi:energy-coupling factor transport system permease protein
MVLGRYYPVASIWHRRDPRVKVFVLAVLVAMVLLDQNLWWQALAFAVGLGLFLTARLPGRWAWRTLWSFRWLLGLIFLLNLVLTREGNSLVRVAGFSFTDHGLRLGCAYFFRLVSLLLGGTWLMGTTEPMLMVRGIAAFLRPFRRWLPGEEIALVIGMALRFFPLLLEEAEEITLAQRARGVDFRRQRWPRRIKGLLSMVIPLFLSALRRSGELTQAMEARGFVPGAFRTSYTELGWESADTLTAGISVLSLLAGLAWRWLAGS